MTNAVSTAVSGMTIATNRAAKAARDVVEAGLEAASHGETRDVVDISESMVEVQQAAIAYKANAAVARVTNEMERELIDRFDQTV